MFIDFYGKYNQVSVSVSYGLFTMGRVPDESKSTSKEGSPERRTGSADVAMIAFKEETDDVKHKPPDDPPPSSSPKPVDTSFKPEEQQDRTDAPSKEMCVKIKIEPTAGDSAELESAEQSEQNSQSKDSPKKKVTKNKKGSPQESDQTFPKTVVVTPDRASEKVDESDVIGKVTLVDTGQDAAMNDARKSDNSETTQSESSHAEQTGSVLGNKKDISLESQSAALESTSKSSGVLEDSCESSVKEEERTKSQSSESENVKGTENVTSVSGSESVDQKTNCLETKPDAVQTSESDEKSKETGCKRPSQDDGSQGEDSLVESCLSEADVPPSVSKAMSPPSVKDQEPGKTDESQEGATGENTGSAGVVVTEDTEKDNISVVKSGASKEASVTEKTLPDEISQRLTPDKLASQTQEDKGQGEEATSSSGDSSGADKVKTPETSKQSDTTLPGPQEDKKSTKDAEASSVGQAGSDKPAEKVRDAHSECETSETAESPNLAKSRADVVEDLPTEKGIANKAQEVKGELEEGEKTSPTVVKDSAGQSQVLESENQASCGNKTDVRGEQDDGTVEEGDGDVMKEQEEDTKKEQDEDTMKEQDEYAGKAQEQDAVKIQEEDAVKNQGEDAVKHQDQDAVKNQSQDEVKNQGQDAVKNQDEDAVNNQDEVSVKKQCQDAVKNQEEDAVKSQGQDAVKNKGEDAMKNQGEDAVKNQGQDAVKTQGEDTVKNQDEDTGKEQDGHSVKDQDEAMEVDSKDQNVPEKADEESMEKEQPQTEKKQADLTDKHKSKQNGCLEDTTTTAASDAQASVVDTHTSEKKSDKEVSDQNVPTTEVSKTPESEAKPSEVIEDSKEDANSLPVSSGADVSEESHKTKSPTPEGDSDLNKSVSGKSGDSQDCSPPSSVSSKNKPQDSSQLKGSEISEQSGPSAMDVVETEAAKADEVSDSASASVNHKEGGQLSQEDGVSKETDPSQSESKPNEDSTAAGEGGEEAEKDGSAQQKEASDPSESKVEKMDVDADGAVSSDSAKKNKEQPPLVKALRSRRGRQAKESNDVDNKASNADGQREPRSATRRGKVSQAEKSTVDEKKAVEKESVAENLVNGHTEEKEEQENEQETVKKPATTAARRGRGGSRSRGRGGRGRSRITKRAAAPVDSEDTNSEPAEKRARRGGLKRGGAAARGRRNTKAPVQRSDGESSSESNTPQAAARGGGRKVTGRGGGVRKVGDKLTVDDGAGEISSSSSDDLPLSKAAKVSGICSKLAACVLQVINLNDSFAEGSKSVYSLCEFRFGK